MAVMVKMHNGDVERFDQATSFATSDAGLLSLGDEAGRLVALFAPGWAAAFKVPARKQSSTPLADADARGAAESIRIARD